MKNEFDIKCFNEISKALNLGMMTKWDNDPENEIGDLISIGCNSQSKYGEEWNEIFVISEKSEEYLLTMFLENHGGFFEPPSKDDINKGCFPTLQKAFASVINILVENTINNISVALYEAEYEAEQLRYLNDPNDIEPQ